MKTKTIIILLAAIITFFSACKQNEVKPEIKPELKPVSIETVKGDNQSAEVETALSERIEIIVKDQNGDDMSGVTVNFKVAEGSISADNRITNSEGKAFVDWTLGATEGIQILTVSADTAKLEIEAKGTYKTTVTDIDGNTYNVVKIGEQIWMANDLYTTHYANGEPIQLIEDGNEWANLEDNNSDKAYCFYENNQSTMSGYTFGALYTWAAASNGESSNTNPSNVQGVCPNGWHLPSNSEWEELSNYLGYNAGEKLKADKVWYGNNYEITNETGFSALPNGKREYGQDGDFYHLLYIGNYWSSCLNNNGNHACRLSMHHSAKNVSYYSSPLSTGISVRCVRDE